MEKLTQGQCEGHCDMCDIDECDFDGCVQGYDGSSLTPETDHLLERMLREEE